MPFLLKFPKLCPNSVFIHGDIEEMPENPLGVIYIVKLHVGQNADDFTGRKATSVKMMIDKVGNSSRGCVIIFDKFR